MLADGALRVLSVGVLLAHSALRVFDEEALGKL